MLQPPPPPVSAHQAARLIAAHPTVVVDARSSASFHVERINGAIRPPSRPALAAISHCHLLVYDTGTTSLAHTFSTAVQLIARLRPHIAPSVTLALLAGGLTAVRCTHPHLIHTPPAAHLAPHLSARLAKFPWAMRALHAVQLEAQPPARILPTLYLGAHAHSTNPHFLRASAVTHVLSVGDDFPAPPDPQPDDQPFERLHLALSDTPATDIAAVFPRAVDFLEGARLANTPALVHCRAGASRSVAIVVAYLLWLRWPLHAALAHVKALRPAADPNRGFLAQLSAWELRLASSEPVETVRPRPVHKLPAVVTPQEESTPPASPFPPSSPITPPFLQARTRKLQRALQDASLDDELPAQRDASPESDDCTPQQALD